MDIKLPQITAADVSVSPSDCVITPNPRNPTEVTISSAAAGLTNLDEGTLVVITAAQDPTNRGVYLVTSQVTDNTEYTMKKQGDCRAPVGQVAGSATIVTCKFAKKVDAEEGVTFNLTLGSTGNVQPQSSMDGEVWVALGSALTATGVTTQTAHVPWLRLSISAVGSTLDMQMAA